MSILTKLLERRGIQDPKDLKGEEKDLYESWKAILSEGEISVEKIKEYCQSQLSYIETKWADYDKENTKKAELIPYYTVYKMLVRVIEAPRVQKELLEQQLNQLLK